MSHLLESRLSPQQRAQACAADAAELAADAAELAAEAAMRNLRAAQAVRATLNTAAQAIDVSRRYCFDADYGSYTGSPLDPRSDSSDDEAGDMIEQINCAEQALRMARASLEGGRQRNLACTRALMAEARGCLTGAAADPALLAAMKTLMNGAWPYLTAVQQEDAMAAIEAATGEAL